MTSPEQPAPAHRMVQVPAEALRAVLNTNTRFDSGTGWSLCGSCNLPLYGGKHADFCPIPALQAALAVPQPQPGGPGVGEPSAMAVLLMVAAAVQNDQEKQKAGISLFDLTILDPAHLRALAQTLATPEPGPAAEVQKEWAHGSHDDGCVWEMGYASREAAIAAGREQAEDHEYAEGFYVARMVPARPVDFFSFDASNFLEACEAAADEDTADGLSDFQRQVRDLVRDAMRGKEERNASYLALCDLHRRVETAFVAWADEQRLDPGFRWARDPEWVPLATAPAEGGRGES